MEKQTTPEGPITFEELKEDMARLHAIATEHQERQTGNGLFIMRTANEWIEQAHNRPIPKQLFRELWYEGEVCVLFADTNTGKSILAVQIADEIGQHQPVLYFDFELSDKQFEGRYSENYEQPYDFPQNLKRIEIDPDAEVPEGMTFEKHLGECMERMIAGTGAKVLIVDNLTYLKHDNERAKDASPLMKQLKALKSRHGLSILALSHTPKRDMTQPLTENDLIGSKMLMNFCDSAFAIGRSAKDKSVRYLKQIKTRPTEVIYDGENVILTQIIKTNSFLHFDFIGYGTEWEHLKVLTDSDRVQRINEAMELKQKGFSNMEIGRRLCVSEGAVRKWVKQSEKK